MNDLLSDLSIQSNSATATHSLASLSTSSAAVQAADASPGSHSSPQLLLMTPNAFTSRCERRTVYIVWYFISYLQLTACGVKEQCL